MKRNPWLFYIILPLLLLGMAATYTVVKISQFPNTASLAGTDLFLVASGSANKNISWTQLQAILPSSGGSQVWTNDSDILGPGCATIYPSGNDMGAFGAFGSSSSRTRSSQIIGQAHWATNMPLGIDMWGAHVLDIDNGMIAAYDMDAFITNSSAYADFYLFTGGWARNIAALLHCGWTTNGVSQLDALSLSLAGSDSTYGLVLSAGNAGGDPIVYGSTHFLDTNSVATATRFKATSTNAVVLQCPNGGAFILTVKDDGSLNVVTNSTGL